MAQEKAGAQERAGNGEVTGVDGTKGIVPFRIEVPEAELAALRLRLQQTRWPGPSRF